jgi:predicted flap endonuclease-1-like 5' DNA nuclease
LANLIEIEGIGPAYAARLGEAGLHTTDDLLTAGATSEGRDAIAERSGIARGLILEWVNHADLLRIDGVGSEYADLLEAAGVDTVLELARRVPASLRQKLAEVNGERHLVRALASESEVRSWVEQAKGLDRAVFH